MENTDCQAASIYWYCLLFVRFLIILIVLYCKIVIFTACCFLCYLMAFDCQERIKKIFKKIAEVKCIVFFETWCTVDQQSITRYVYKRKLTLQSSNVIMSTILRFHKALFVPSLLSIYDACAVTACLGMPNNYNNYVKICFFTPTGDCIVLFLSTHVVLLPVVA